MADFKHVLKFRIAVSQWCGVGENQLSNRVYRRYYNRLKKLPTSVFRVVDFVDDCLICKEFNVCFIKINMRWHVDQNDFRDALREKHRISENIPNLI
jgi:hypothetical protein